MNTRFLETFVWLCHLRSFSRTAEKLNTTQPSVSSRINKLEEILGVRLYDRNERRFNLTPAGRRILHHAQEIVTLSSELRELAYDEAASDVPVSIGVVEMVTMSWLPMFIAELTRTLPTATVYVGTGTTLQLLRDLRDGKMDLILVVGPVDEPNVTAQPICTLAQHWMANPKHFDCEALMDVVALSQLPVVLQRVGSSGYDAMIEYFRSYGILNMPVRDRKLTIDCAYSLVTAIELVRAGLAIVPLPSVLIRNDLTSGELAPMNVLQTLPSINIVGCWKRPVGKVLIEHLMQMSAHVVRSFAQGCDPAHIHAL